MRLKGKVAIVTGGARDIGREVSIQLAKEGARVVVNYYDSEENALETKKDIEKENGECILVKGDMTQWKDAQNVVKQAIEHFGKEIHILINVAGGLVGRKPIEEPDETWYNRLMDVNVKTVFLVTKATIGYMPSGSSIINYSSQAARDGGGPGASLYATAKGAVMTYTRALAKEFGPRNIRVNALLPGMIATTFHDRFTKPEVRASVAKSTPLRREGQAKEIAALVVYLASDESSFITGANIDINGGTYFS
jgi:3-oxoacyl-[acyl-carrier protein] reductase